MLQEARVLPRNVNPVDVSYDVSSLPRKRASGENERRGMREKKKGESRRERRGPAAQKSRSARARRSSSSHCGADWNRPQCQQDVCPGPGRRLSRIRPLVAGIPRLDVQREAEAHQRGLRPRHRRAPGHLGAPSCATMASLSFCARAPVLLLQRARRARKHALQATTPEDAKPVVGAPCIPRRPASRRAAGNAEPARCERLAPLARPPRAENSAQERRMAEERLVKETSDGERGEPACLPHRL